MNGKLQSSDVKNETPYNIPLLINENVISSGISLISLWHTYADEHYRVIWPRDKKKPLIANSWVAVYTVQAVSYTHLDVYKRQVLGLSSMTVSILFILPIPAAFFGAWFAGRPNKRFSTLMWQSVICCLLAGLLMWIPDWFGVMNVWTLLIPAALFFFGAGMLFPLATSGAMEPFPFLAGTAGALVGGLQNIGSGVLASLSAMLPQTGQGSLGLLMTLMGLLIVLCWLPLATRMSHQGQPV